MEEVRNRLIILVDNQNLKTPQRLKAFMIKNKSFIFLWHGNRIHVYETSIEENQRILHQSVSDPPRRSEVNLKNCIIDIFQRNDDFVYALDQNGFVYKLQFTTSTSDNYMEVEDFFSSPATMESTLDWKETVLTRLADSDEVKHVCTLSSSMAIIAVKDENTVVLLYSLPECNLKFVLNLQKYASREGVLSSCVISSISPNLKQHFKENLEIFDEEIVVIGLASGLVLWFCANNPSKGPYVLCYAYQKVQSIHWLKDSSNGLYAYLLVLLDSGQIVVFGGKHSALYLPDSVKSSYSLNNFIITSNFVDCYSSEILFDNNLSLKCISLPVKGVCAMTCAPGPDTFLIVATVHGSVYCFDPTADVPESSTSLFTLPDQSLLDNMFLQTQNLDKIYKQLSQEEDILKAMSAAVAGNLTNCFQTTVKVLSDGVFSLIARMAESKIIYQCALWSVCVEVTDESGCKDISFHKMEHDLSSNKDLTVNVRHSLTVSDVVSAELVYLIENHQPLLIVPVGKVEIDACHLMSSQILSGSTSKTEETLKNILEDMNNEPPKQILMECKLMVKIPPVYSINSVFKTILSSSQHRFPQDEWDKLSNGKKFNVSISISGVSVLLNLDVESREIIITSPSTQLCHHVRKALVKALNKMEKKSIPENLTLDFQAIHQTIDIESLKEELSIKTLDSLRKNLRTTVSAHLAL